jgi:di/tricarboxylate transporter
VIERVTGPLLRRLDSVNTQVPAFAGMVMLLSMLTKNVGALAIAMPVAMQQARRTGTAVSRLLMPMSFASLLGGMVTLVGTSPNIVVSSVRQDLVGQPFAMFDFAPVALIVCGAGLFFLAIAHRWLGVDRKVAPTLDAAFAGTAYVTEVAVRPDAAIAGKTIVDLRRIAGDDVRVLATVDADGRRTAVLPDRVLAAGDRLVLEGDQAHLDEVVAAAGLELVGERHRAEDAEDETALVEAIVREDSPLADLTPSEARLHGGYGLSLLAVSRGGERTVDKISDMRLRAGDVVLVKSDRDTLPQALQELRLLPLSERNVSLGQRRFLLTPIVTLAAAMLLVAFSVVPVVVGFCGAALLLLLLRVIKMDEVYRSVDLSLLVLLGALIPVSETIRSTGGDKILGALLADALQTIPPVWAVAGLIVFAMAVTPFLNNAATVLILAPIAAGIAGNLKLSPDPFLMAIAVGAACDFLTPIGHQCNTLVMTPGGYRFADYWRLGLPLSIIVVAVAAPAIVHFWPMRP